MTVSREGMPPMIWKRARSPEQKEQRRTAILAAATELFETKGLEKASLNAIAKRAGFCKANVYHYFESREEIFLHLVLDDYRDWAGAVERALAPLAGGDDEQAVARELVASMVDRPRLASLAGSMTTVLEKNVSTDVVVWFKTSLTEVALRLANAIQVAMPGLTMEGTQRFLMMSQLMVAGMWPAAHPPAAVREALERPELAHLCIDFERDFGAALVTMLRGLKVEARTP